MSGEHSLTQTQVLKELVRRVHAGEKTSTKSELCETFDRSTGVVGRALGNLIYRKLARSVSMSSYVPTAAGMRLIAAGKTVNSGPRPGKQQAPRKCGKEDSLRARLWRAIITLKKFTVSDVIQRAARDTDANPAPAARRYVNYLVNAGYLVELPRRSNSGAYPKQGEKIFWLKDSAGRLPPRVRKSPDGIPGMFDPNDKTYRPFPTSEEGKAA